METIAIADFRGLIVFSAIYVVHCNLKLLNLRNQYKLSYVGWITAGEDGALCAMAAKFWSISA